MVVLRRRTRRFALKVLMAVARLPGNRFKGESAVIALGSLGLLP